MELIERIMSKVVGKEISAEELLQVAGGREDMCSASNGYPTVPDEPGATTRCDHS